MESENENLLAVAVLKNLLRLGLITLAEFEKISEKYA
jgi:hypothetical protein